MVHPGGVLIKNKYEEKWLTDTGQCKSPALYTCTLQGKHLSTASSGNAGVRRPRCVVSDFLGKHASIATMNVI